MSRKKKKKKEELTGRKEEWTCVKNSEDFGR